VTAAREPCRGSQATGSGTATATPERWQAGRTPPRNGDTPPRRSDNARACWRGSQSAAQARQAVRHASTNSLVRLASEPAWRDRTVPVVAQTAAQSRSVRMHWTSSDTMSSARQASAHAVQACEQSKHASLHSVSFARSSSHPSPSGGTPTSAPHATWRSPTDGHSVVSPYREGVSIRQVAARGFPYASVTHRLAGSTAENTPDGDDRIRLKNATTAAYQLTGLSSGPTMCP